MAGYATPAWANDAAPAINATNLTAMGEGIEIAEHPYGVCSTAAATAAKTVTIDYSGTLTLFTGLTVRVKFTNGNSAASPTLNVNSTGAIAIVYGTALAPTGTWTAGAIFEFIYDGTNWVTSRTNSFDTIPTDSSKNLLTSGSIYSALQRKVNKNILENWYWVGGGNAAGVFPINQRGLTTYTTTSEVIIDRWRRTGGAGTITLTSVGLRFTSTANPGCQLDYRVENYAMFASKTVTLSCWCTSYVKGTLTMQINGATTTSINASGLHQIHYNFPSSPATGYLVRFYTSGDTDVTISAVKLEIGDEQTLLYYDNGTWKWSELPNYAEEYQKCLRYYWNAMKPGSAAQLNIPLNRMAGTADTNINANLTSPVAMRVPPSISGTLQYIRGTCGTTTVSLSSGFTLSATSNIVGTQIQFTITHSSYVFPSLASGLFAIFTSLQFSAEL